MEPLVSVVVPVFNGMPHLKPCAESILGQTHQNLEIIFSEGGGSDDSGDYLRTLDDPRIRIISQPPGTSAAANWTAATEAASGDFIKLICQDDLLHPEAIQQQVSDLEIHPSAVMAIAPRDIIDASGAVIYRNRGLSGLKGQLVPGQQVLHQCYLKGTNVIGEPLAVLFRAKPLKAVMPWQDDNPLMLDLTTYTAIAPHGDVAIRRDSVGAFRVSASSWSTRLAREQLDQTRQWQETYASQVTNPIGPSDRLRSFFGRHMQVNLRRAAYWVLRHRGRLST